MAFLRRAAVWLDALIFATPEQSARYTRIDRELEERGL